MSTYSPDLRIELIGTGDQAGVWGATTNNNLTYVLEQAIAVKMQKQQQESQTLPPPAA